MATKLFQAPHGSPAWFHAMVAKAAASDEPIMEIVEVNPSLAGEMLKNNPDNRILRTSKLTQMANDIRDGRWVFNGEPIIISRDGLLNDGQHRANAVVEANCPIKSLLVFGLARESRTTLDQGGARSAGDYLMMQGVKNGNIVASVGRWLLAYESADGKGLGAANYVSNGEIIARYGDDPFVARAATFATTMNRYAKRYATPQMVGFSHTLFSRLNPTDAEAFMRQVCMGENIKKTDPAFAVREGLMREKLTALEKIHIIFRGWNSYRQKRPLSLAKVQGNLPALL